MFISELSLDRFIMRKLFVILDGCFGHHPDMRGRMQLDTALLFSIAVILNLCIITVVYIIHNDCTLLDPQFKSSCAVRSIHYATTGMRSRAIIPR